MRSLLFKIGSAPIPFRTAFGHAAASRETAANVLVQVEDTQRHFGLGEGCPRQYVTGETLDGARAFLAERKTELSALDDFDALRTWIETHEAEIDANPSAFRAAELALLDLFARRREVSVETLLGVEPRAQAPAVSAIYGTGGALKFRIQSVLFLAFGMREAKLKASGDSRRDAARAARLARRGRVRVDANNLWPDADHAIAGLSALAPHVWAVEEPVAPGDWRGMADISQRLGLAIIADESFTRLADLEAMPAGFVANVRVSKLGGLVRTLACVRRAREQDRPIVVGAQVGETSILARGGLVAAAGAGDRLVGYEGCYGVRLLKWDLVAPSIGFGLGGRLETPDLGPHGLGLRPVGAFHASLA